MEDNIFSLPFHCFLAISLSQNKRSAHHSYAEIPSLPKQQGSWSITPHLDQSAVLIPSNQIDFV